jgi:hypothetical protein
VGATVVAAGLLGTAGCSSSSSSSTSSSSSASASASAPTNTLTFKQIILGTTLKHSFQPNGKGAAQTEFLTQPDDIVTLDGNLYVGFQNGVGSQGEAAPSGNLDSTLLEFTPAGSIVKQWDVTGKIDGMGADPATGQVIATVNEDSKSSLYTVSSGTVTHYTYTPSSLPHMGGTDAIAVFNGKILISASAPGTAGKAPASAPAVYVVTLNAGANTAAVTPFFADNATATGVNGSNAGKKVTLALTDPDSFAGTWTRAVTPADLQKANTSQPPPAGRWGLRIDPTGWQLNDPTGGGLLFDVRYQPAGSLQMRPTIEYPPYPNSNGGGFCEDTDPLWAWTYSVGDGGKTLTLRPLGHDPCGDRIAILAGTWTRTGT